MRYTVSADSFLEIPVTTGTIQNVSSTDIEVSNEEVVGSGLVLKAGEMVGFNNATVYVCARPVLEGGTGIISVVPFSIKGEGGGGGGSYVLPIASKTVLGGVKSSDTVGKVTVNNDATMTYNPLGYRQPSTAYAVGNIAYHNALPTGWYLECTTAGTSGSGALTISSPAIGGTVTDGTVVWTIEKSLSIKGGQITGRTISRNVNNDSVTLAGGNDSSSGAYFQAFGKTNTSWAGEFNIVSNDGLNIKQLRGLPNGQLIWNGNNLAGSAIVAKFLGVNGYIKYASGLIVQWGYLGGGTVTGQTVYEHTFPIPFTAQYAGVLSLASTSSSYSSKLANFQSKNLTTFYSYRQEPNLGYNWLAIGY